MSIINEPTFLMLEIATIMLLPILYALLIPFFIYNPGSFSNIIYYYVGIIIYYTFGSLLNLSVYFYTLYYLDDLNWNRQIISNDISNNVNSISSSNNNTGSDNINDSISSSSRISSNINDSNGNNDSNDSSGNICGCSQTYNCCNCSFNYGCNCNNNNNNNNNNNKNNKNNNNKNNISKNIITKESKNEDITSVNINELWDYSEI